MWPFLPYVNASYVVWHLLKLAETEAETEADIDADHAEDPLLSEAEAVTMWPELHKLIYYPVDRFETGEHIVGLVNQDLRYLIDHIRNQLPADCWNAIVPATAERSRQHQ